MVIEDMPQGDTALAFSFIGLGLLSIYPFSDHQLAAILSDKDAPVSVRLIRSWTQGPTLRVQRTQTMPGATRKAFGFLDLLSLVLAKRLIKTLPPKGLNTFLNEWWNPKFIDVPLSEKLDGKFLLVVDPTDAAEIKVHFFSEKQSDNLTKAMMVSAESGHKFAIVAMHSVYWETLRRLCSWIAETPFQPDTFSREGLIQAFKIASDIRQQIDRIAVAR